MCISHQPPWATGGLEVVPIKITLFYPPPLPTPSPGPSPPTPWERRGFFSCSPNPTKRLPKTQKNAVLMQHTPRAASCVITPARCVVGFCESASDRASNNKQEKTNGLKPASPGHRSYVGRKHIGRRDAKRGLAGSSSLEHLC